MTHGKTRDKKDKSLHQWNLIEKESIAAKNLELKMIKRGLLLGDLKNEE